MSRDGQPSIVVNDEGVTRYLSDGKIEHVAWRDLVEVSIVTTDEGPFTEDMYYLLLGFDGSGCVVPSESPASTLLQDRFAQLPGFDYEKAIAAVKCVTNARFVCWKSAADHRPGPG
jgi:hypothetical protein